MKKFAKILLTLTFLFVTCIGLVACNDKDFSVNDKFVPKESLSATEQGSFFVETGEFYYCINGVADSASDNKFGTPVVGSLVAVKKDFSDSAVVVPKLFASSDYNAGLYIFDGYVFYASPSTNKTLSGDTKNTYLTFAKTKLDGTGYKEFFTVKGLSSEYRIFKDNNGEVCIVYYDTESSSIVWYNTKKGTSETIVKTSDSVNETLTNHVFASNSELDKGILAYSVNIYKGEYKKGTTRATETYNKVYLLKTDKSKNLVLDGSDVDKGGSSLQKTTFEIKKIINGSLLYTKKTASSTEVNYIDNDEIADISIFDSSFIKVDNIVYTFDSTNSCIKEYDMNSKASAVFAKVTGVDKLLFIKDGYIYFYDSEGVLLRTKKGNTISEIISDGVCETDWYNPVYLDMGEGNDVIIYSDATSTLKRVELDVKLLKEEKDKDDKLISKYFDNQKFVAEKQISDSIKSLEITNMLNKLPNKLDENGKICEETKTYLEEIENKYNSASKNIKDIVKEDYKIVAKYKKAIEIGDKCLLLDGIDQTDIEEAKANQTYKDAYNSASEKFKEVEKKGQDYLDQICNLLEGNGYYLFDYAKSKVFKK